MHRLDHNVTPTSNLAFALLTLAQETDKIQLPTIFDASTASAEATLRYLHSLAEDGVIQLSQDMVCVDNRQKVLLAATAAKHGADLKAVCSLLTWQDFESVVEYALNLRGFKTAKHVRSFQERRWFEIDILAASNDMVMAVDCKRWKTPWTRSRAKDAAEAQLRRVQTLTVEANFSKVERTLGLHISRARIVPVIVTLGEAPCKVYMGVPIVPILKFRSFLDELYGYLDSLATLSVTRGA